MVGENLAKISDACLKKSRRNRSASEETRAEIKRRWKLDRETRNAPRLAKRTAIDFATKSPVLLALREKVTEERSTLGDRTYEGDEEFELLSRIR